jgi:hypothetical protein
LGVYIPHFAAGRLFFPTQLIFQNIEIQSDDERWLRSVSLQKAADKNAMSCVSPRADTPTQSDRVQSHVDSKDFRSRSHRYHVRRRTYLKALHPQPMTVLFFSRLQPKSWMSCEHSVHENKNSATLWRLRDLYRDDTWVCVWAWELWYKGTSSRVGLADSHYTTPFGSYQKHGPRTSCLVFSSSPKSANEGRMCGPPSPLATLKTSTLAMNVSRGKSAPPTYQNIHRNQPLVHICLSPSASCASIRKKAA